MPTVQWMWGDASVIGHGAAQINPFRWSARKNFSATISDLQGCRPEFRRRPVEIRIFGDGQLGRPEISSQHCSSVLDAIERLQELSVLPPPAPGRAFSASASTTEAQDSVADGLSMSRQTSGEQPMDLAATDTSMDVSIGTSQHEEPAMAAPAAALTASFSAGAEARCAESFLAGMLEKKSHWRAEWGLRFLVMRQDRIDYYLTPPAIIDDESCESRRGFIPLTLASATEDSGRTYCIQIGTELISCKNEAERQRWLATINTAAAVVRAEAQKETLKEMQSAALSASNLLFLREDGPLCQLPWQEPTTLVLPSTSSSVTLLFLHGDAPGRTERANSFNSFTTEVPLSNGSGAHAMCRIALPGPELAVPAKVASPVHLLTEPLELICSAEGTSTGRWQLHVRLDENTLLSATSADRKIFQNVAGATCALAVACLLGGSRNMAVMALLVTCILLFMQANKMPPAPSKRQMTMAVERLEEVGSALDAASAAPRWVGRWKLDKTCSELYAPILEDMGVHFLIRKAADAANSTLTITTDQENVNIHLKIWVSVEDCIPLDGSWTSKPVPPGAKMKGDCRVRLTKNTDTELEMYTEFPDGFGDLRDTLTVHADGQSFTRVVVRGNLSVTRVFRKVP